MKPEAAKLVAIVLLVADLASAAYATALGDYPPSARS